MSDMNDLYNERLREAVEKIKKILDDLDIDVYDFVEWYEEHNNREKR